MDKSSAAEKFNIIHQAYTTLSNVESRMKYNEEGSTVLFARPTIAAEWEKYLKTISIKDMNDAFESYIGSNEEKTQILQEFVKGNGSMIHVYNNVPFVRRNDEARIIKMIQEAFAAGEIQRIAIKKLPKMF